MDQLGEVMEKVKSVGKAVRMGAPVLYCTVLYCTGEAHPLDADGGRLLRLLLPVRCQSGGIVWHELA